MINLLGYCSCTDQNIRFIRLTLLQLLLIKISVWLDWYYCLVLLLIKISVWYYCDICWSKYPSVKGISLIGRRRTQRASNLYDINPEFRGSCLRFIFEHVGNNMQEFFKILSKIFRDFFSISSNIIVDNRSHCLFRPWLTNMCITSGPIEISDRESAMPQRKSTQKWTIERKANSRPAFLHKIYETTNIKYVSAYTAMLLVTKRNLWRVV